MLDVDAVPTAWREAGDGAQVALFLHGLGGSRIAWEPQLRALSKVRRVVAWDCPGYGASQPVVEPTFAAYANAAADLEQQVDPFAGETSALKKRYGPKVQQRDFDGNPGRITEADALIAYLQALGTFVDFKLYDDKANIR